MADGELTPDHIEDLASTISTRVWEKVVLFPSGSGLTPDEIKNIKRDNPGDSEAQSTEMLRKWENKNSENSVKTLAKLLYKEAGKGNVKPRDIQRILGLTKDQAIGTGTSGAPGGATAPAPSGGKLTERKIRLLSKNITDASQLRDLGTLGLGVPGNVIDKHLNERDITEAAIKVINDWKRDTDEAVAYEKMCEALIAAKLRGYITAVLEKD